MADPQLEALLRVEKVLTAILGVQVEQLIRDTKIASPRPRSIDRMLSDFGLTGAQIAALLGKTPQAVSQALARDTKKSKSSPVADGDA